MTKRDETIQFLLDAGHSEAIAKQIVDDANNGSKFAKRWIATSAVKTD